MHDSVEKILKTHKTYVNSHGLSSSYDSVRLVDQFTRTRNQGRNYRGIGGGGDPENITEKLYKLRYISSKIREKWYVRNIFLPTPHPRQQFWEKKY